MPATFDPVQTPIGKFQDGSVSRITWNSINNNLATCTPVALPTHADKSIQVIGNTVQFDGCSVAIHGSNDGGVTYAPLNDPTGTVIAITTAKIKAILENTEFIKPVVTGGNNGNLNINIAIVARLSNPLRT